MATSNQIDIEVVLDSKQAQKNLSRLDKAGEATGETFNAVGSSISSLGGEMNEALGSVGSSIGGLAESLGGLKGAAASAGGSFTAMIGPIGLVALGIMEVVRALKDYTGETARAEIRVEAYKAATAELTSIVEELAAAQVELTQADVERLRQLSMNAKIPLEEAQAIREKTAAIREEIEQTNILIATQRAQLNEARRNRARDLRRSVRGYDRTAALEATLRATLARRGKLQAKIEAQQQKAVRKTLEGSREFAALEAQKEKLLKTSEAARAERAERERQLEEAGEVGRLERTKNTVESQRRLAVIESERRVREIRAVEDVSEKSRSAAIEGERQRLAAQIEAIEKAAADKAKARRAKLMAERRLAAAKRLALERQRVIEEARIERAKIERERIEGAEALKLLDKQLEIELRLVGDNERAKTALTLEFENKRLVIEQQAAAKKKAEEKKAAEEEQKRLKQRQGFILDSLTFDAQMMQDGVAKELKLLSLKYVRRIQLEKHNQEELTELNRRYEAERLKLLEENANQGFAMLESNLDRMGESLTSSLASGVFDAFTRVRLENQRQAEQFSEQFEKEKERIKASGAEAAEINRQLTELSANYSREREAIRRSEEGAGERLVGDLLLALGKQASVEALMMTAKGFAAMFTNPPASTGFFTAAGIMGAAAVAAGVAGSGLISSNPASTGGGSIAPSQSPTGSPQTTAAPERAQAENAPMVFNINFGNATVYDTKRAAQDALTNEIMRTMARRRRGAPRMGA